MSCHDSDVLSVISDYIGVILDSFNFDVIFNSNSYLFRLLGWPFELEYFMVG